MILVCETSDSIDEHYCFVNLDQEDARRLMDRAYLLRGLKAIDLDLQRIEYAGWDAHWIRTLPEAVAKTLESGQWAGVTEAFDPDDHDATPVAAATCIVSESGVYWQAYHKHGDLPTPFESEVITWDAIAMLMESGDAETVAAPNSAAGDD